MIGPLFAALFADTAERVVAVAVVEVADRLIPPAEWKAPPTGPAHRVRAGHALCGAPGSVWGPMPAGYNRCRRPECWEVSDAHR